MSEPFRILRGEGRIRIKDKGYAFLNKIASNFCTDKKGAK